MTAFWQTVTGGGGIALFRLSGLFRLFRLFGLFGMDKTRDCQVFRAGFSGTFGLRGIPVPSPGRPRLSFGREGFPQARILEDRSASALPAPSRALQASRSEKRRRPAIICAFRPLNAGCAGMEC